MSIRDWRWWKWAAGYFPIRVVKTTNLKADGQNYLLVCHPHGLMSLSIGLTFGTESVNISRRLFPGFRCYVLTLWSMYVIPFIREWWHAMGGRPASDDAMTELFSNSTNTMAALVVGGARDIIVEQSDQFRTVVRRRQGFCRIALKTGTHLVPVISFGEDQTFTNDTFLRPMITRLMDNGLTLFAPAMISGRWFTVIPHQVPITMVIGAPVRVPRIDNPTPKDIDHLNGRYCEALSKLYDDHKSAYGYGSRPLVLL